ncbi:MAG: hypothetical protein Q9225_000493 [Loekoesia sp. 1 TL-2023]
MISTPSGKRAREDSVDSRSVPRKAALPLEETLDTAPRPSKRAASSSPAENLADTEESRNVFSGRITLGALDEDDEGSEDPSSIVDEGATVGDLDDENEADEELPAETLQEASLTGFLLEDEDDVQDEDDEDWEDVSPADEPEQDKSSLEQLEMNLKKSVIDEANVERFWTRVSTSDRDSLGSGEGPRPDVFL